MRPFFYRGRFIFIPLAVAAFLSLASFVVMNLWNWLVPVIFHLTVITFWQAMGIFVLSKILFGFGKGGHRGGGGAWMRHGMAEKLKHMSPEEREKFKEKWGQRCGHDRWAEGHNWNNYTADPAKTTE
jgi:hypothetical protein